MEQRYFRKVFTLNPKALKKVIEAKDASAAEGQEKTTVAKMIEYKPSNFDDCVGEAVRKFYKYFRNNVRQLPSHIPTWHEDQRWEPFLDPPEATSK